ncbi:hypothetical protein JYK14_17250 [Siccirubricoccus sp. KC 17139]|uniref:Uncharacterized protein n=1 Tax=Siccirubricoccus soli TaxID=2899147 RepID=A0ABT1D9F1_9PROT|nr:hypothetical protein [Siccirubricoccus soli]MCO6417895.1 hypothetical protein [Siccirubricoccus soli]MCP2684030.1 hypothetical protein [Siccirubricoccus soli]
MAAQPQFPALRVVLLAVSGLLALLGLIAAAMAQDLGIAIFGWGLIGFGLGFGFFLLKRGFDEGERLARQG